MPGTDGRIPGRGLLALLLALVMVAQPAAALAAGARDATSCGAAGPEGSCCAPAAPSCCCGVSGEDRCGSELRPAEPPCGAPTLRICDCGADPLPLAPVPSQQGARGGVEVEDVGSATSSGTAPSVAVSAPELPGRAVTRPARGASPGCRTRREWRPPRILHGVWRN